MANGLRIMYDRAISCYVKTLCNRMGWDLRDGHWIDGDTTGLYVNGDNCLTPYDIINMVDNEDGLSN